MAVTRITHRPIFESHVKESKNSLGFWIPSRGFRIRATLPGTNRVKIGYKSGTNRVQIVPKFRHILTLSSQEPFIGSWSTVVFMRNVYNLRLLHSIWTHARYCFEKILLSWILLKWPPCTAPLSENDPPKPNKIMKVTPAKFTLTPFLYPHRFPFEESRRKVSICPIVLSASLRTMNSRCYGPFCGWGWGRGAWLAIGDAWNPEKSMNFIDLQRSYKLN